MRDSPRRAKRRFRSSVECFTGVQLCRQRRRPSSIDRASDAPARKSNNAATYVADDAGSRASHFACSRKARALRLSRMDIASAEEAADAAARMSAIVHEEDRKQRLPFGDRAELQHHSCSSGVASLCRGVRLRTGPNQRRAERNGSGVGVCFVHCLP